MDVLVTGGTGYVGSHAVASPQGAGHGVRLLVRSADRVTANLSPWLWWSLSSLRT